MFKALLLEQEDGKTQARVQDVAEASLPAGEVLLAVHYSSLNYKDGLAITGKGPIVRRWPMVPGIDLVGRCWSRRMNALRPATGSSPPAGGLARIIGVAWPLRSSAGGLVAAAA